MHLPSVFPGGAHLFPAAATLGFILLSPAAWAAEESSSRWLVDETFAPSLQHVDDVTRALSAAPDGLGGYWIVGGNDRAGSLSSPEVPVFRFTHVDDQPFPNIVHLLPDGSIDPDFQFVAPADWYSPALQATGDGGFWARFHQQQPATETEPGTDRWELRRFRADGTPYEGIATVIADAAPLFTSYPGGGLVIWGDFTTVSGEARHTLAVISPDGSVSPFTVPWQPNEFWLTGVRATPSGDVLASGTHNLPGNNRHEIVKLGPTGTPDSTFAANITAAASGLHRVKSVLSDGRFYTEQTLVYRFLADGAPDPTWQPVWAPDTDVREVHTLADGRVILETLHSGTELRAENGSLLGMLAETPGAGSSGDILATAGSDQAILLQGDTATFLHSGWEIRDLPIDRLIDTSLAVWSLDDNTITELDHTFTTRRPAIVSHLRLTADGSVSIGGDFTSFNGTLRKGMARLKPDGRLEPSFTPPSGLSPVLALRDGSWIARQRVFETLPENTVATAMWRTVHLLANGSISSDFAAPVVAQDESMDFMRDSSRWWGERSDGLVLMSAPGLVPSKPDEVAFAWIDPESGSVMSLLAQTFPQHSLDAIPPIDHIDPILSAVCTPQGRVAVLWFPEVESSWWSANPAVLSVFKPDGQPDTQLENALSDYTAIGWNTLASNEAGDILATVAPVDAPNSTLQLVINREGTLRLWDNGSLVLYRPLAPDSQTWVGDDSLADSSGAIDPDFSPDFERTYNPYPASSEAAVTAIRDASGRLWIGGAFDRVDGRPRDGVVRLLESDGVAMLTNLSARGEVTRTTPLIAGFVPRGADSAKVLIRALGEGLRPFWPDRPDAAPLLAAVDLRLHLADGTALPLPPVPAIDPAVANAAVQVGAFPLPDSPPEHDPANAAYYGVGLNPGLTPAPHTFVVRSADDQSGVALLEVYDADNIGEDSPASHLTNVSIRGAVGDGDRTLTAGFVIEGNVIAHLLLRGVGPGLANWEVATAVSDPRITLFSQSGPLASNDDWENSTTMNNAVAEAGAFTLSSDSADAAMVVDLPPGVYTLQLHADANDTGEALLEVYLLNPPSVSDN